MNGRYPALSCALMMLGCAGAPSPGPEARPVPHPAPPNDPTPATSAAPPSRALGMSATFGELVSVIRALDDAGAVDSEQPCLVRHLDGGSMRVDADLAVAVRPLPEASTNLAGRLRATSGAVQVLGRWGRFGPVDAGLNLVAMTSAAPRSGDRRALALFVTHTGVHLRSTGFDMPAQLTGVVTEFGAHELEALRAVEPDLILLTADAPLPLGRVLEMIRPVTELGYRAGFAVLLPPETRLPPTATSEEAPLVGLCPAGLPALEGVVEGSRDARGLRQALSSVQASTQACMSSVGGGMTPEGVMQVLLRIGPGGGVAEVCATQDDLGVAALRICILERLRGLDFGPAGGFVDVSLPLRLVNRGTGAQRLECRELSGP